MTATLEDAISGWVSMEKKRLHPAMNSIFLRSIHTTIRIMEKTPRDLKSPIIDRPEGGSSP